MRSKSCPPGTYHQLSSLLEEVKSEFFTEELEASIMWGRAPRRTRRRKRTSIVFGSWWEQQKRIRIHPALDRPWVPEEFIRFIIYHELCHAVAKPKQGQGRKRQVHHPEFKALENRYPDSARLRAMSRDILARISKEEMSAFSIGRRHTFR